MRKKSSEICSRLAAPEPAVLRLIGEESRIKGTHTLSSRQIDRVIKTPRTQKTDPSMIPLRLVIDRNIPVSAPLKPDGLQHTVLVPAITKPARLYVTNAIRAEYREVLARPEFNIRRGLQQQLLQLRLFLSHIGIPSRNISS